MNYSAYDLNGELGSANIDLVKILGRGATAEVHVASLNGKTYAAKIYHKDTRVNSAKIRAMLANPPESMYLKVGNASFAQFTWPIAMLRDSIGYDVGFLMPMVDLSNSFPLDYYYDQTLQKKLNSRSEGALSYKLEIARNVCILVSDLHSRGHNFIDLKPQNIRVQRSSHVVSFLDCDGFSISGSDNQHYPAELVSTDYISPEAFKQNISPRNLGEDQDLYALAVILFQLLTRGTHPFQGIIRDQSINANTNDEKASLGLYPHGMKPDARISPRPQSIHFLLDDALWALFDAAFIGGAGNRPKAKHWVDCLNNLLANHAVTRCEKEPNDVLHMRFAGKNCPACYLANLIQTKPLPTKVADKSSETSSQRSSVTHTINSTIPSFTPVAQTKKPSHSNFWVLLIGAVISMYVVVSFIEKPYSPASSNSATQVPAGNATPPTIVLPEHTRPINTENSNTCMYSVRDESSNELCMVYLRGNETSCNKQIEDEFRSRGLSLKATNCGEPLTARPENGSNNEMKRPLDNSTPTGVDNEGNQVKQFNTNKLY